MSTTESTRIVEGHETVTASPLLADAETRHGMGDRGIYYKKWDAFTKDEQTKMQAEEAAVKKEGDEAASKGPQSDAHKKDLEKRVALKEAKKQWDGVSASEEAKKIIVANEKGCTERILDFEKDLGSRGVVILKVLELLEVSQTPANGGSLTHPSRTIPTPIMNFLPL